MLLTTVTYDSSHKMRATQISMSKTKNSLKISCLEKDFRSEQVEGCPDRLATNQTWRKDLCVAQSHSARFWKWRKYLWVAQWHSASFKKWRKCLRVTQCHSASLFWRSKVFFWLRMTQHDKARGALPFVDLTLTVRIMCDRDECSFMFVRPTVRLRSPVATASTQSQAISDSLWFFVMEMNFYSRWRINLCDCEYVQPLQAHRPKHNRTACENDLCLCTCDNAIMSKQ